MYKQLLYAILIAHCGCALIYSILILMKRSRLRREFIIPILLVPVFSILAAAAADIIHSRKQDRGQEFDLHKFNLDNDAYWKTIIQRNEGENILPLEEAVLINDNKTRRRLMLETLYYDPVKYVDVLMVAKNNEDIETAHYAATTISKIQRDFQLGIQKLSAAVDADPLNVELLDQYLNIQENYINSGVLEDYLLERQRVLYSKSLDRKLAIMPEDKAAFIKKIKINLELKDYDKANKFCEKLQKFNPRDEDTWIESLKVCVESKDVTRLEQTIGELKNKNIDWSKHGREKISPWLVD